MPLSAASLLQRDFNELRCRLLDLAAGLDRIERGAGSESVTDDPRLGSIRAALKLLGEAGPDRAARVQMVFSIPYDPNWRSP